MIYRDQRSIPRWKASLISGMIMAAGFYASADPEMRSNNFVRTDGTLKTTKQNYGGIRYSSTKLANSVMADKGSIVSKR